MMPVMSVTPASTAKPSLFVGPRSSELLETDLGRLLERQAALFGDREAVVFPGRARLTYHELNDEVSRVAKGLLALGVSHGDRIGILAGNCHEYIALVFATGRIGAILVLLNTSYTPEELRRAVSQTGTKFK
jgi:acyl-CoA synthetase (AMP-forming)/AMP-acid ligase II